MATLDRNILVLPENSGRVMTMTVAKTSSLRRDAAGA